MWHEQAGAALADASREVLETMCFVAAEEVPGPEPAPAVAQIAAQVEFRGHWTGRCMVEIPESCARIITGNFTGELDPDHVTAGNMIELLCEFANIVCGGTITRLQCPGIVTLAPPHLIYEWPTAERPSEISAVERWLDTGDGVVRVGFETEAAA
jgi:CheY-specific phosphatase CheX